MRRFLLVAVMCGAVRARRRPTCRTCRFSAAVFTDGLSTSSVNWQGFYVGGQAGYGAADMDFTNADEDLLAKLLNNVDLETQLTSRTGRCWQVPHAEQRLWRVRRIQLPMGRRRPRSRGRTTCTAISSAAQHAARWRGCFHVPSRQHDVGDYRERLDADQGLSVRCGSAADMRRQFPALCVRRRCAGAGDINPQRPMSTVTQVRRHRCSAASASVAITA